jgi:hypothetical protein
MSVVEGMTLRPADVADGSLATLPMHFRMSALPLKADINDGRRHVR